jgi:pantoate--beta-alanine ligase
MGALHEGHASLLRAARQETDFVVVSIFVNPTQFGPNEDLARYPRTLEQDLHMCAREGAALVFAPEPAVIYPPGFCTYVEVQDLQGVLCGLSRPNHFRGVATVVLKLFHIVGPDLAYFGQKDAQQVRLLQQMVQDLNVPVQLRVCPIVREPDGLAMSSRNQYLNQDQRRHATALFHALEQARQHILAGERDARAVADKLKQRLETTPGARLDYAAVVDYSTLRPVERLQGTILIALAVFFGATRLIDNLLIDMDNL